MFTDSSILCPVIIGRAQYLNTLALRLEQAQSGQAQLLLLSGEAGIGKSRLVAESKTLASQHQFNNLQGSCFESDRILPYAPLVDLIRNFIKVTPSQEAAAVLHPIASELIKLLPEISTLLPDARPSPLLEPEPEKRRHFQMFTQFLARQAGPAGRPMQIIFEDLHWCDDTSLEFLGHFIRDLSNRSILLLLTYRNDEVSATLQHFLAELDRSRLATELTLARLTAKNVDEMIRAIFEQAQPVRPEFADAIYSLTDGNPFFVEEILKALVTSGDIYRLNGVWTRKPIGAIRIPRTIHDAVQRRVASLSEPARRALTLAAVFGRRFDFALLQNLTQHSESSLLPLVKELIDAQLVVEESADRFAFRHALTQQAVYTSLLARERKTLHQQITNALETLYAPTLEAHLGELALHSFAAEAWEKTLTYARQAAERATALYSPRAAVENYTWAITAARHLSAKVAEGSAPAPVGTGDLMRARGQMYQTLGDFDNALIDYQTVLDQSRAHQERHAEWQALMDLGFLWAARNYEKTGDYFRQALTLAGELADSANLAHNLNRLGNWHLNIGQSRDALGYHHEAMRMFEALGDRPGLASTHDLLGITYYASNDVHTGIAHYEQAIDLFRQLADRGGLASSLVIYASRGSDYIVETAVAMPVPLAERLRSAHEALAIAQQTGARPAETITTLWLGMNLSASGDYSGLDLARAGLEMAEEISHQHFCVVGHMILGMCYLDILVPDLARNHLEHALVLAQATNSAIWVGTVTACLARAYIHLSELEKAGSTLQTVLLPNTPMQTMGQCQLWAASIELLLAQGKFGDALEIVERLIASLPNIEKENGRGSPRLNRLRGEALTGLRRYATSEKLLRSTLEWVQVLELRPHQWRVWADLNRLYRAQGKAEMAAQAAQMANQIVNDLAASLTSSELQESFRKQTAAQWAEPQALSQRDRANRQFGGLTARERQVAALIAHGKSNLEIAETLVLSHRTVEAHIGNIFSKLGFTSRAQLAVWAVEKGLR